MKLAYFTLLVRDYDEAIAFYVGKLGFTLREDTDLGAGKRWVVVAPDSGAGLLLAKATTPEQAATIGNQTGGRVGHFLHTGNFSSEYERLSAAGIAFETDVRHEPYGRVVVFKDLYGNRWDLVERQS